MSTRTFVLAAGLLGIALAGLGRAADLTAGMEKGTPELKSAGPATFAPQGILLVGDTAGATIFAIATGDTPGGSPSAPLNVEKIDEKIAALLGTTPKQILINDMAVNPETGNTFLTVSRGTGPDAKPVDHPRRRRGQARRVLAQGRDVLQGRRCPTPRPTTRSGRK